MSWIKFKPNDSSELVLIQEKNLDRYPDSLLTLIKSTSFRSNYDLDLDAFRVNINLQSLKLIKFYYNNDIWINPYTPHSETKLVLDSISGSFEMMCEYLGLGMDYLIDDNDSFYKDEIVRTIGLEAYHEIYYEYDDIEALYETDEFYQDFDNDEMLEMIYDQERKHEEKEARYYDRILSDDIYLY